MNNFLEVFLFFLATWRFSVLFVEDIGPYRVFEKLRQSKLNDNLSAPLNCLYCMSIWGAIFIYVMPTPYQTYLVSILAMSAGVLIIDLMRAYVFK